MVQPWLQRSTGSTTMSIKIFMVTAIFTNRAILKCICRQVLNETFDYRQLSGLNVNV